MLPSNWPHVYGGQPPKRISILSEEVEPGCRRNLAKVMKVSKTSLYDPPKKQQVKDMEAVTTLRERHLGNPYYGVRRLSIDLGWSVEKTRRIRNLAGVKALKRNKRHRSISSKPEISAPVNELRQFWVYNNMDRPQDGYKYADISNPNVHIWVQDFTYIWWNNSFYYLAVTLNLSNREVVGWSLGRYHNADLICDSLLMALAYHKPPQIVHNDRSSEYMSQKHSDLCNAFNIQMSASAPSSPWQNGFMERFFATFKNECSDKIKNTKEVGELYEAIANWIYYYNHNRIHTSLKMSPIAFAQKIFHKEKSSKKNLSVE